MEIEDCLLQHPTVALAEVVKVPDEFLAGWVQRASQGVRRVDLRYR
jgi:acyl-coenzyme A synthetase/AMP-(fatty) acid ligase